MISLLIYMQTHSSFLVKLEFKAILIPFVLFSQLYFYISLKIKFSFPCPIQHKVWRIHICIKTASSIKLNSKSSSGYLEEDSSFQHRVVWVAFFLILKPKIQFANISWTYQSWRKMCCAISALWEIEENIVLDWRKKRTEHKSIS